MKRTLSLILVLIMLSVSLFGCTKKEQTPDGVLSIDEMKELIELKVAKNDSDNKIVMTAGDYEVSLAEFRNNYINYSVLFSQYYGFDWKEDEQHSESFQLYLSEALKMCSVISQIATEKNIYLTEEELTSGPFASYDSLGQMYGENVNSVLNDDFYYSPYYMVYYETFLTLYQKLYNSLYGFEGEKYEEIKDKTILYFNENDYIRATHILVSFPTNSDGSEVTEEQKSETYKKAEEVISKLNSGESFENLIPVYNEDPGLTDAGYYFGKGRMVKPFEEAAYALSEGEVSGIVESPFGYHIIKRLPMDDASITSSDIYMNFANTDFQEMISKKIETTEIVLKDKFEDAIKPVLEEEVAVIAELKAQYEKYYSAEAGDPSTQSAE